MGKHVLVASLLNLSSHVLFCRLISPFSYELQRLRQLPRTQLDFNDRPRL